MSKLTSLDSLRAIAPSRKIFFSVRPESSYDKIWFFESKTCKNIKILTCNIPIESACFTCTYCVLVISRSALYRPNKTFQCCKFQISEEFSQITKDFRKKKSFVVCQVHTRKVLCSVRTNQYESEIVTKEEVRVKRTKELLFIFISNTNIIDWTHSRVRGKYRIDVRGPWQSNSLFEWPRSWKYRIDVRGRSERCRVSERVGKAEQICS